MLATLLNWISKLRLSAFRKLYIIIIIIIQKSERNYALKSTEFGEINI